MIDMQVVDVKKIRDRAEETKEWLGTNCPNIASEQRHLDVGTKERNYWAYGYLMALEDVLSLLSK